MATFEERLEQEESKLILATYFAEAMTEELGKERALKIILKGWAKYGADRIKSRLEGVPTEDRLEALGEWFKKQAETRPELKVVEATPKKLSVEFSWCPTYEVCKKAGNMELCRMYCDSDFIVTDVIHPKVKLVRDKELAYGAAICNHSWIMED